MNIAQKIIEKFGGVDEVCLIVDRHPSNIHRWTYPKSKGGTGGLVPAPFQQTLLDHAYQRGIDLSPSDFFENPFPGGGR